MSNIIDHRGLLARPSGHKRVRSANAHCESYVAIRDDYLLGGASPLALRVCLGRLGRGLAVDALRPLERFQPEGW